MVYSLEELFDLQMGKTPSRNNFNYWNTNDNKWVLISDLSQSGRYIHETKEYISDDAIAESGIKVIPANTVIMSFKLSIGKVAITKEEMYSNEAIMAFHDKHTTELLPEYIYYLFRNKDWSIGTNKAVMGKTLNKATLSQMKISVCSIQKQREIVSVLNKVSEIIDNMKDQIFALDVLIKSRFVEMFGDPEINQRGLSVLNWENVFITTTGKLDSNAMIPNGKYPFFTCAKESFWIDQYAFDCEALLLAGNNAAGVYDVKHYKGKFNAYQRTYVLRLVDENWSYVLFKRQLEEKLEYLREQSKGTNTRYLTMEILNGLQFIIPDIAEQNQFTRFVHQVDKLKLTAKESLKKLEIMQKALMQQYFC